MELWPNLIYNIIRNRFVCRNHAQFRKMWALFLALDIWKRLHSSGIFSLHRACPLIKQRQSVFSNTWNAIKVVNFRCFYLIFSKKHINQILNGCFTQPLTHTEGAHLRKCSEVFDLGGAEFWLKYSEILIVSIRLVDQNNPIKKYKRFSLTFIALLAFLQISSWGILQLWFFIKRW